MRERLQFPASLLPPHSNLLSLAATNVERGVVRGEGGQLSTNGVVYKETVIRGYLTHFPRLPVRMRTVLSLYYPKIIKSKVIGKVVIPTVNGLLIMIISIHD